MIMALPSAENGKVSHELENENRLELDLGGHDTLESETTKREHGIVNTAGTRKEEEEEEEEEKGESNLASANNSSPAIGRGEIYRPKDEEEDDEDVEEEVRSIIDHIQETELDETEESTPSASAISDDTFIIDQSISDSQSSMSPWRSHEKITTEGKDKVSSPIKQRNSVSKISRANAREPEGPNSPQSPRATNLSPSIHRNSLPPDPEPEIRFNFHLFLEQLRHRTADPVARYLRSFLFEFGKKQWTVQEQVRIISDFLTFISSKMAQCEIWRDSSESEFDNAREGMEKLVMNRLYAQTFSPELPPPALPASDNRGRRKPAQKQAQGGRRGQHQEDVERDHVLSEKMQIFGWVEEQHLDIASVKPDGKRFLVLAQQELLKINNYRAPRDKVICILNACKVIFGLLRSSKSSDTSADSFMPLLIYTVLRSKPQHMVSNIQYIFRFRNQEKLGGETGYYLSSLMGAVQFIETLDRTALTITDLEFEQHVEASVAAIAEKPPGLGPESSGTGKSSSHTDVRPDTKAAASLTSTQPPSRHHGGNEDDDAGPVQGILRNIQRPLTNLGRMFSDEPSELEATTPMIVRSSSGRPLDASRQPTLDEARARSQASGHRDNSRQRQATDVDIDNIVETLSSMFPSLDKEVISDIVMAKQARVGAAVDACLSLTS